VSSANSEHRALRHLGCSLGDNLACYGRIRDRKERFAAKEALRLFRLVQQQ